MKAARDLDDNALLEEQIKLKSDYEAFEDSLPKGSMDLWDEEKSKRITEVEHELLDRGITFNASVVTLYKVTKSYLV